MSRAALWVCGCSQQKTASTSLCRGRPNWSTAVTSISSEKCSLVPVPGIEDALDRIPWTTCGASSGSHAKLRRTLGITALYSRFEGRIFSATEVAAGKPAPDLFLHAAARLGVSPDRCVVVEDSRFGGVPQL
ncbi:MULTISPECIES: HAD-IA family hydrolase [unclassified Microbacterium]|uniref:HAD-IA family hydrolase n=1 Tax=unclassified Microbacterium TaxID=2609290 RepID=UPI001E657123|nr:MULTISPECIES: HAD-IA family hydrolase [unclassified Microbacterium]HWK77442.1 HAD-IA family hydrolase [Microbacterium sp.]